MPLYLLNLMTIKNKLVSVYPLSLKLFERYFKYCMYLYVYVHSLNIVNEGRVAIGDLTGLIPCTPNGVIQLIKR